MKEDIKVGITSALPIVMGYFPVAMAFGLLAKNTGLNFVDTGLFSVIVYAGASQFMALDLINAGISMGSIILATFLLNLRHMMMSAALSVKLEGIKRKYMPLVAFGITDETFSVSSFHKGELTLPLILTLHASSHFAWFMGTIVGFFIGEILPASLQESLGIGLYAMFAALLFPNFKGSKNVVQIAILTAVVYLGIFYSGLLPAGWDLIVGIILSSALGAFFLENQGVKN